MGNDFNLTKEQEQVIEVKNRDVLVSASAGSGKTFIVVERIINRVINDGIDVDKILVVTFTNAAASELKERILNRFYDILKKKDISDEKKTHVKRQLSLINRAQICTIHSFCLNVIRNNFFILNIDPGVRTLDENKAKLMVLESIDEIIEEEYDKKSDVFLKALYIFKSEENLINYIEKLYNFSRSMVDPKKWLEDSLKRYNINNDIKDLSITDFGKQIISLVKQKVELMCTELENVCNKIRDDKDFESRLDVLENMLEKLESIKSLKLYDDLYNYIQNNLFFQRLPNSKCVNEDLKKEVTDIKKKITSEIDNILKIIYKDTKGIVQELNSMHGVLKWLNDIILRLDEIYYSKKKISGQIDFNDYEHLTLEILKNKEICKEYQNKFEEIYIDEYQDTSYIQETILKNISRNNRIMVGDVKQSIYSFRNAEPKLFNEKYYEYPNYNDKEIKDNNPVKIILSKNFRSRETVLNSVNDVFKKVMSKNIGECDYSDLEYLVYGEGFDKITEKNSSTEINIIQTENEELDTSLDELEEISSIEKEAHAIADKIEEIMKSEYKLYDLKAKKYRNVEYKDIVILLRSIAGKANIYEEVLKSKNIPCFSDVSDGFYNGQEVLLILSLLKVIDNRYDDIALVSVMYSIIGKFTLDELICIRNYDKKCYFYDSMIKAYKENINKDLHDKIGKFLKLIDKITVYLNTYSIAETLYKIYEDTGIYYSFYLEEMGKQKCANLDSLIEIARNFEKEEKSSIYEFINYIESMKERKTKGNDTPKLLGEGENVVRILTIHKSKGLEYPIVFLANTSKKYNILDTSGELIFDKELGIGIDIYNIDMGISYASIIKQAIKEKIKEKTLSEEERLLYVAMTRAKEKLLIYGTVKNYDNFIDKLIISEAEKISPVIVKECNNYLKLIMLAVNNQGSENFNINVINYDNNISSEKKINENSIDRSLSIKNRFLQTCKENKVQKKEINIDFEKNYRHIESINTKKKYTVTEIKTDSYKKEFSNLIMEDNSLLESLKPKVIEENISNVSYGTIIHEILEMIDYTNIDINYIIDMINLKFRGIKGVNIKKIQEKILNYLNSDIVRIVKDAKQVRKEQPFVIYDDLKDLNEINLKEKSYIQGVIDLFVVTNNNKRIIVDFKTDKVENYKELVDKYKVQLEVYKKGIELSLNEKVDETYIYSFNLEKLIKLD